jgi:uncharacterized membrane protein
MRLNYFLGAFYLFFINAVFISLTTYLISRYLHFPTRPFVDKRLERRYRQWFLVISMVVLAPSIYFLYTVYRKEIIKKDIAALVIQPIKNHGNEILKWEIESIDTTEWIKIYHSGSPLEDSLKKSIDSTLATHRMKNYRLKPMRVNLTKEEVSQLSAEMTKQMFQEMHLSEIKQEQAEKLIIHDTLPIKQVNKEVKIAFPYIDTISAGSMAVPDSNNSITTLPVVFYGSRNRLSYGRQKQLYAYLKVRLAKDTLVLMKR